MLNSRIRMHYAYKVHPSGSAVMLLHGYADSWFSYSNILPLLDSKYRIYILDQRGHGKTTQPMGGYAMQQFAADVIAFMNEMKIQKATIVGHSMGSFVAQHVAVAAPERVNKLVLEGTATTIRNNTVLDLQREINLLKDTAPVPESFVREFQIGVAFQPLPQEFLAGVVKESLNIPAHVWREVMAEMVAPEANAELKKIKTPTLIIWGDKETIFFNSAL